MTEAPGYDIEFTYIKRKNREEVGEWQIYRLQINIKIRQQISI